MDVPAALKTTRHKTHYDSSGLHIDPSVARPCASRSLVPLFLRPSCVLGSLPWFQPVCSCRHAAAALEL